MSWDMARRYQKQARRSRAARQLRYQQVAEDHEAESRARGEQRRKLYDSSSDSLIVPLLALMAAVFAMVVATGVIR